MNKNKTFNFLRDIVHPASFIFLLLLAIFFIMAIVSDVNVMENETIYTQVYDDAIGDSSFTADYPIPYGLSVPTLFGLFLFALTEAALTLIYKLKISKLLADFIHFFTTIISFYIFVLAMSGYINDETLPMSFIASLFLAFAYFVIKLIIFITKLIIKKIKSKELIKTNPKIDAYLKRYIPPIFSVFALILFAVSLFALVTQIDVIASVRKESTFIEDDVLEIINLTVATPLAPTLQNYLRYLATAAIFMISYSVLFTKLNTVAKVIINFLILTTGYMGIWIVGFDYFRLVKKNAVPAIIIYLSVYLVTLIVVSVTKTINKRKNEIKEDYKEQFR